MALQRIVGSPQSDENNQILRYREGKDDQNHRMDIIELEVFMAGLQNEVAYVSQTWESSLT